MAFDLQKQLDSIVAWCKEYWYVIALVLLVVVLIWLYMKKKPTFKPISRAEIERKSFVERNKMNRSNIKWAYRGDKLLGQIKFLSAVTIPATKEYAETQGVELVIKPQFLGFKGLPDIFSKDNCVIVSAENSDYSFNDSRFDIMESTTFDKRCGIFYDRENKEAYIKYIKDRLLIADDWEDLSSVYYTKAMEQATITPEHAIETQNKQLELEAEKEKRKHLIS